MFGSSKNGNGAKLAPFSTKKSSPPIRSTSASRTSTAKRTTPLAAFTLGAENDATMAARIRDKKLDRDIGNIAVNKAKIDLLAQREAGEMARKQQEHQLALQRETANNERLREQNQLRILELQLRLQAQPAAPAAMPAFGGADKFGAQAPYPINAFDEGVFAAIGRNDLGGN